MRKKILAIAKDFIQQVGFDSVSFRDIASAIGIKSSSIHYHFPSKNSLAIALIEEEIKALDFLEDLQTKEEKIGAFIDLFQNNLSAQKFCICGMLSIRWIDEAVTEKIDSFFSRCVALLLPCFDDEQTTKEFIALCEGGLLLFHKKSDSLFFQNLKKRSVRVD
jgi:TetR/AcrR family transcriptional repressor of nem operon